MEAKTKRNITIWAIVLLIVLNISSLSTIWYHRYQFRKSMQAEQRDRRINDRRDIRPNDRGKRMPPFIVKGLDLSDQQKVTIDSIWKYFENKRTILEDSMDQNRRKMFALMAEEELDTSVYEEISATQMALFREMNDTMFKMNREVRTNLTDEQNKLLTERYKEMRKRANTQHRRRINN